MVAIEILAACQAIEFHRPSKSTPALEAVHALVRQHVEPWDKDRIMHTDIDVAVDLLRSGKIWQVVAPFLDEGGASVHIGEPDVKRARTGLKLVSVP